MRKIQGKERTVRELLGHKYTIDYYQRDYKWETKQVQELIEDLTNAFLDNFQDDHHRREVKNYGRYFLGSVIISEKDNTNYIVDGQQRLTSLTLLMVFLNNLQHKVSSDKVNIDDLVFSEQYGERSFNLVVEERSEAMDALYSGVIPDTGERSSESVRNIVGRYQDIEEFFPPEIDEHALPFFIDWLIENVDLVQITAYSDDDAYTIFETMNDRGLSLSPVEMLKGFLLTNITNTDKRTAANELWKEQTQALRERGREDDFFKSWLRSQYAMTIRGKAKGTTPGDFERIGSEFHRWVRQHADDSVQTNSFSRKAPTLSSSSSRTSISMPSTMHD